MNKYPYRIITLMALLSLLISIIGICFKVEDAVRWNALQLGPLIMQLFIVFSLGTLMMVGIILILSFIFGRFYCAFICPFGIIQQFINDFLRFKYRPSSVGNYRKTRYLIAFAALGSLCASWSALWCFLDPFNEFEVIISGFLSPVILVLAQIFSPETAENIAQNGTSVIASLIPLAAIFLLVWWKRRIFCTAICPVGTLLGVCSKYGMFQLQIDLNKCVRCGKCRKSCPADCICLSPPKLDNERCLRCMHCLRLCEFNAITFSYKNSHLSPSDLLLNNEVQNDLLCNTATTADHNFCSNAQTAVESANDNKSNLMNLLVKISFLNLLWRFRLPKQIGRTKRILRIGRK